ncbi:MAG: membrane protein insertase YidC, partial [Thermomonas sp.]
MTQTRTFLFIAWLMVAAFLWMEWNKEHQPQPVAQTPSAVVAAAGAVPSANIPAANIPSASVPGTVAPQVMTPAQAPRVSLRNDMLVLELDGRSITSAKLLKYHQS